MEKIRVGIVNYRNTKPLIYGLEREPMKSKIDLVGAYPARLAQMLIDGQIDVGLIPVGAIPLLKEYYIVGNYCIGAEAEIASVCLFSEVPLDRIERVYLDYQSRSSVALLKWLMKESWGIHPEILEAEDESYRDKISGTTAGLVIGDRALEQRKVSTYIYDLGSEWKGITGLPFVFAAWVSTKPLDEKFIEEFDKANAMGLELIDEIVASNPYDFYDMKKYYTLHLSYELTDAKKKGMQRFLDAIITGGEGTIPSE
ncbi:menaquinone biosynthesis protein [Terrimonas sp. NA20]|uniref:Chorismate dehydratase n=1 Tax=Terrimonas ginsenosidimutans TaxID=2908004 RepID=A0ABS9KSZ7_9BACT|nr:menaquinone biosynthesis protein [Terrimonas ginsenosidimutans]MCG2615405.1 menaquinone biosynthesis protein [Terrimonas ginsenosidimutans]